MKLFNLKEYLENPTKEITRGKKCKLVIREAATRKIVIEEEYNSIISAKRALKENYNRLCNVEYAIFRDGKEEKFRRF